MNRPNLKWQLPVLLLLIVGTIYILRERSVPYQKSMGRIFGTIYHVTYQYDEDLNNEIYQELQKVDASLSPFNKESIISRINRDEDIKPDSMFLEMFYCAQEISKRTEGAFDITIAPLANVWGFGFKKGTEPTASVIDSILQFTDYRKVSYENDRIIKKDERIMISGSAIAKGFGSDMVGRLLERYGIKNYMVEVGGEIVVKGMNPMNKPWRIAINKPIDDSLGVNNDIQAVLELTDIGMATSGNYRNYYIKDGKKYAHSIDPRIGYPVEHTLLSTTVLAKNCMIADGFATSFMIMGYENAKTFIEASPDLEAYLIYLDANDNVHTYASEGLKKYLIEEK